MLIDLHSFATATGMQHMDFSTKHFDIKFRPFIFAWLDALGYWVRAVNVVHVSSIMKVKRCGLKQISPTLCARCNCVIQCENRQAIYSACWIQMKQLTSPPMYVWFDVCRPTYGVYTTTNQVTLHQAQIPCSWQNTPDVLISVCIWYTILGRPLYNNQV